MRYLPGIAIAALLAAGCGDDDADTSAPSPSSAPADSSGGTQVAMKDIKFVPAEVTVKAGTAITWTNEDSVPHDVVNEEEGQEPKSELFGEGKTYSFTPSEPGTITYLCTVHPGMEGTITVE